MKKIRMIVSAALVLSVVGGALAFKTPNLKLWICDEPTQKCVKFSEQDFRAGSTLRAGALSEDLSNKSCEDNCDGTTLADPEGN